MGLRPIRRVSMQHRRRRRRVWIHHRRRRRRRRVITMILSIRRSKNRWRNCGGIDGRTHRQRNRRVTTRVLNLTCRIWILLHLIGSAILRRQNRVPGDSPLENLRRVGPNPLHAVREMEDPVGPTFPGPHLVAHEPRRTVGGVADQIGERHAAFSDELVA